MRDPTTLPRQQLSELYLHTQHPYRCPKCRMERIFLVPGGDLPVCPECNVTLEEDVPKSGQEYIVMGGNRQNIDWSKDVCFLHEYTPSQAKLIVDSIPETSFHWAAISWGQVGYYAKIVQKGKWVPYGQYWHPVRFSTEGDLMTGAQRMLAINLAQKPMKCWTVDHSGKWFTKDVWTYDG